MVLRQYAVAKGLGIIVTAVIFVIIIGIILVPFLHVLDRGTSEAKFGFPSSSDISSASGINANFEEKGNPSPTNGSALAYNSGIVSGEYVYYNSTSDGFFELFEFKMSSNDSSNSLYSHYYSQYYTVWKGNRSKDSISANISTLGFTYFYFQGVSLISYKLSVGFSGSYAFLLLYLGDASIDINNTAEAVIMQM
ncbi:MAG: hypothetical protein M1496_06180 [Candidatus Thermoplasmatota archaeon]|nr:hypothetical protein [Candidatus Thermoplasmatota archaeon]